MLPIVLPPATDTDRAEYENLKRHLTDSPASGTAVPLTQVLSDILDALLNGESVAVTPRGPSRLTAWDAVVRDEVAADRYEAVPNEFLKR